MEVKAKIRYLHIAPRKVRLVADVIRGMGLAEAERELEHRVKRSSPLLLKLLRSAAANAGHNFHIGREGLAVKDIRVDPGPVTIRYRPRAFGRAAPIRRRTSHVTLLLEAKGDTAARTLTNEAPAVREAHLEDLRGEAAKRARAEKPPKERGPRPKTPGFIRRIFQRKAI